MPMQVLTASSERIRLRLWTSLLLRNTRKQLMYFDRFIANRFLREFDLHLTQACAAIWT